MLATFAETPDAALVNALDIGGQEFASFVVDHGLGPRWHVRTGRWEFHASRMTAESLYLVHLHALESIDAALGKADIRYVVIKGAANRLLLYENPAIRACHDIDLLVHPDERVRAAEVLIEHGYEASPKLETLGHELELSMGAVTLDLHWGLLREGRLRQEPAADMLARRRRVNGIWMFHDTDAFFLLLVHPAFAKHLAGWNMGLHRAADITDWLRKCDVDWPEVCRLLESNGVATAAWATLRWLQLLTQAPMKTELEDLMVDIRPGYLRRRYLNFWLRNNLSARTASVHWARLFGFSVFLHDTPGDVLRAFLGRYRARRRQEQDLAVFSP